MGRYIIRRLLQAIPLLFLISIIVFVLIMNMGDPLVSFAGRNGQVKGKDRERLIRQLGLDQPLYMQYIVWLIGNDWMKIDANGDGTPDTPGERRGVLRGDLGTSVVTKQPVLKMIGDRLPNTLLLMFTAEIVIIVFALLLGILSAVGQYSWYDNLFTGLSFVGFSMPVPLLALGLIYIFGVYLKRAGLPYFPTVGMFEPSVGKTPEQVLWHMALPIATLAIISIAAYSRFIRSNMLEVSSQDYMRTARSKGLSERLILFKHALKNAALPIVTLIGLDLGFLLAGALVTETIFSWPGMGRLFYDHAVKSDLPVLMGILMLISVSVVFFQIVTDVTYTFLDPRIRYH
ncbi:MAG: Glutathione transport system permease protein GsiC [Anaerolineae bacterium]|nr:Glutathione transport system permease protein GsiC [Anaerolineae bacterium]